MIIFSDGPEVKIFWVDQRDGDTVKEGEKLELKCEVAANPPHHTILWFREVSYRLIDDKTSRWTVPFRWSTLDCLQIFLGHIQDFPITYSCPFNKFLVKLFYVN